MTLDEPLGQSDDLSRAKVAGFDLHFTKRGPSEKRQRDWQIQREAAIQMAAPWSRLGTWSSSFDGSNAVSNPLASAACVATRSSRPQ